jgi:Protein of unknown function (DUF3618)
MPDVDGTETQARHIQRDIDRTREEMDHTLTELERRLSPSELVHSGAETVRQRVRSGATSAVDTLTRHPLPVALAAALLGARLALRPSAADRRRREAQQDFDRTMALLGAAFERAQERAQVGASNLAELVREALSNPDRYAGPALRAAERLGRRYGESTWRTVQRAAEESRVMGSTLRREAGTYPLGTLVLFGAAAAMTTLASRAVRGWR